MILRSLLIETTPYLCRDAFIRVTGVTSGVGGTGRGGGGGKSRGENSGEGGSGGGEEGGNGGGKGEVTSYMAEMEAAPLRQTLAEQYPPSPVRGNAC